MPYADREKQKAAMKEIARRQYLRKKAEDAKLNEDYARAMRLFEATVKENASLKRFLFMIGRDLEAFFSDVTRLLHDPEIDDEAKARIIALPKPRSFVTLMKAYVKSQKEIEKHVKK